MINTDRPVTEQRVVSECQGDKRAAGGEKEGRKGRIVAGERTGEGQAGRQAATVECRLSCVKVSSDNGPRGVQLLRWVGVPVTGRQGDDEPAKRGRKGSWATVQTR